MSNRVKFDPIPAPKSPLPIIIVGVLIIVGGILIGRLTPLLFPPQGSAIAPQIDGLFQFMLTIGGAIFLLVQGVLAYSIFRFRVKDESDRSDGAAFHGNNTLEFIWTMIPCVIVIALVAYSLTVWSSMTTPQDNERVIPVTAQQFAWTFSYVEESIINPQTNAPVEWQDSNLHVIVGENVALVMQAADVNHAFWVPAFRVKQDVLVGRETTLRFTPTIATPRNPVDNVLYAENGFQIRCAELCGGGHGNMSLLSYVVVHDTRESYMEYVIDATYDIINPPQDPIVLGELILQGGGQFEYPCSGCHTLTELGWNGLTGPALDGVGDRADRRQAGLTGGEYIVRSLRHPQEYIVPGYANAIMPQFVEVEENLNYMPDADAIGIAAYLYCDQRADPLDMEACAEGISSIQTEATSEVTEDTGGQ